MTALFLLAAFIVFWTYAGYPLAMAALAYVRPRHPMIIECKPSVDILLVVHNAEGMLDGKITNLLQLDYPRERYRINVFCDGCTDDTERLARRYETSGVRVLTCVQRRGKSACIAEALPRLDSEAVVFVDVRQKLEPCAVRRLMTALGDPEVGVVSGELVLQPETGYGLGIDLYWRYEKLLRKLETASGSVIGVTGALYGAKRALLKAPPAGIILDDMWIPLSVAQGGHRIVFASGAIAYDVGAYDRASEEARKRRTLAGNYQLLHRWPQLALPGAHPLALRLWGHKWLRLLAPWCLLIMLGANLMLLPSGEDKWYATFALQLIAYAMALSGRHWPALATAFVPVRICSAFFSLNLSALMALFDYIRNPGAHLWRTTQRTEALR